MKIRSKTISYAAMKKHLDEKKEKDLENSIQSLEAKIALTENECRGEVWGVEGSRLEA